MVKLVIFDLDGTLVDAYAAIQKSINFTRKELGYPAVSLRAVHRAVGWGDRNFVKKFMKAREVDKGLLIYHRHHRMSLLKYSKLMPKAKQTLAALKKRGYKIAIASNRFPRYSHILIGHLRLRKYFDLVVCARNSEEIKPSPYILLKIIKRLNVKKEEAVYVGDMTIDVLAGRNAGIRTVAVSGGSSSKAELKKARPFKIIAGLSDLLLLKV